MKALNDIVQQFDPGRGPGRGVGSISSMRRSSARSSGRESYGRMNDLKSKMQPRGESPPGRAERTKSGLMTGQGTHFQSSALRTHMRKDSGAYMDEEEYMYTRRKPSVPGRQDMGYHYGYGYDEEQMMPETMRGTRMDRQPVRYHMDQGEMEYVEEPQHVPSEPMRMQAAPQQVRYIVEQPRMEAAGASRAMGMGMNRGMEYQQPPAGTTGMYRSAQLGGKAAMKPHQTRQLYIEDQPRMQAAGAGAGASRAMGMGYEEQPHGEVYRTSHIGGQPPTKPMHMRYIQEQPRMGTTEARVSRQAKEQPPGQVVRKSHVGAQPTMRPAQRPQTVYVRRTVPEQRVYVQKQPQQQTMHVPKRPQAEVVRAPRVSGNMGQARMRYDQVPREPETVRVPHINGKPATEVPTGQQGMGYVQEQQRPQIVQIPPVERGRTRPVTMTAMRTGPSMRSQRNQRLSTSTYEPISPQELRRESTKSSRGPTGALGVHDSRDAAVSAAAAAILGGKVKPQRRVTHIPTAPAGEFGAGVLRRDSVTLPQRPRVYYDEDQYMEEPVISQTGRLREEVYVPNGTYETVERVPPVVTETVLPQQRVEEVPSQAETPRMAKAEPQPEAVVVNEPVMVGQPIHERVVLPEEQMEQEEEMAREGREEMVHEERMVHPSRLMESQPALTEQVVTEPVVEQEMAHPAIGMPDDEDIERQARMKQMQEETVPGFEAREEVMPEEEAVEEEFQPAREIPSEEEESEDEWDRVTEEEEVTEEYEIREPQPPLAPLAAVPVMAHTTTTKTVEPAEASPPAAVPAAATSTREPVSHPAMYEYQEAHEPRAFEKPVTVSGVMPPGVLELGEPIEEPMIEETTTTIPAAEPLEEHYVSAKPSMESQSAIPITTSAREATVLGTMEPVSAALHEERAFNTRASADAGATGRLHPDEKTRGAGRMSTEDQTRGTGRRSTDYDIDYNRQRRSTADGEKQDMFRRRSIADEQARERARGVEEQESEARARSAAVTAAEEKGGPLDTSAGMQTGQAEEMGRGTGFSPTADTGAVDMPSTGPAAAATTTAGAGAGAGAGATRASTEGMNRSDKRRLEKEEKAREKQRMKEQKQYEANRKAQDQRMAKQRKEEEKQRKASEKKAEKEAKSRRKSQQKEDMQRQKSQEKESAQRRKSQQKEEKEMQRRRSEQARSSEGSGGASQGAGAGEKEHGLSGLWRRVSRTFTGEGSGSSAQTGSGVNQGTRVQQGAQQMQNASRGMETMGRPQDVAVP